jgi:rhodanese-related sulfurtransferase
MKTPWWLPFGAVPEIEAITLQVQLETGPRPQLLDVRTTAEFTAGHLAGAVHAPLTSLRARLDGLGLDPARPVVAICLSAHRSVPAVRLLRGRGFDAVQLAGGMLAWRSARLPEVAR